MIRMRPKCETIRIIEIMELKEGRRFISIVKVLYLDKCFIWSGPIWIVLGVVAIPILGRIFNNYVVLRACIGDHVMTFRRCVSLTRLKRKKIRKINVECGNQNQRLFNYFV